MTLRSGRPTAASATSACRDLEIEFVPSEWGLWVDCDGNLRKTAERVEIEAGGKWWWDVYPRGKK